MRLNIMLRPRPWDAGLVSAGTARKPQPMMSKSPVQGSAGKAEHADATQKSDEKRQVLQATGHILHVMMLHACMHPSVSGTTN